MHGGAQVAPRHHLEHLADVEHEGAAHRRRVEPGAVLGLHLQPAEPTTLGYRLAMYAHDLLEDWASLEQTLPRVKGKGFKGAVGTASSYEHLLAAAPMSPAEMERRIRQRAGPENADSASVAWELQRFRELVTIQEEAALHGDLGRVVDTSTLSAVEVARQIKKLTAK